MRKPIKNAKYEIHCHIGYKRNDKLYLKLSSAITNCSLQNL